MELTGAMLVSLLAQGNIILYTDIEFLKSLQACKLCLWRGKETLQHCNNETMQHKKEIATKTSEKIG